MASAKGRKGGSDLGRAAIDWEAAFHVYASLAPEQRSYGAVAARCGVSTRTVETHGRRERWRARARTIDLAASADVERLIGKTRADQLAEVQRLAEASLATYSDQLQRGAVRLSPADLPRLVKLLNELWATAPPAEHEPAETGSTADQSPSLEHMAEVIRTLKEANFFATPDNHAPARDDDDKVRDG